MSGHLQQNPPTEQGPSTVDTTDNDAGYPSPTLAAAVRALREFVMALEGGVVRQRTFLNRTITYILSRLAGAKPVGRTLVCIFRNHRHGGYRFVTGASQPQTRRIGFYIQMCRDIHTNMFCHFREATNPVPLHLILTRPRLYAALVLREELQPIPRGPGPILEALFAGNTNVSSDPPPPSQPVPRNVSPPTPPIVSPASSASSTGGSRAVAAVDDDFDNPFVAFAEARRLRARGVRHGLNFPDSPIGTLLPHKRRPVVNSDPVENLGPVEELTASPSTNTTNPSTPANSRSDVVDLTGITRIRSVRVRFYTPDENVENPVTFRFEIEGSNGLTLSNHTTVLRQAGVRGRRNFWLLDAGDLTGAAADNDGIWSRYRWDEPIRVDRITSGHTLIVKLGNIATPYD